MKVTIDPETADVIALASLKEALAMAKRARKFARRQEDRDYEKNLIAALRVVIAHYSPPSACNR